MVNYKDTFYLLFFVVILVFGNMESKAQDLTESWKARQVMSKEDARKENAYRHKINFFFGKYWNTSRESLMAAKIQIKNLKASGKLSKAKKLENSNEYYEMILSDLKERAYIANEYGLFSIDYTAEKGYSSLESAERIFIEKAIYRSLSGPVANRIGYKRLLGTESGQDRLKTMLTDIIADYQSKIDQKDYFETLDLPKNIKAMIEQSMNEPSNQRIAMFCNAATETFNEYAADQKEIRELNVGRQGPKLENPELVRMSCEDKRVIIYKKIALASR
ncbi:MAG: hypothetical protein AAFQ94_15940 [Bacteroidota bacterium]